MRNGIHYLLYFWQDWRDERDLDAGPAAAVCGYEGCRELEIC